MSLSVIQYSGDVPTDALFNGLGPSVDVKPPLDEHVSRTNDAALKSLAEQFRTDTFDMSGIGGDAGEIASGRAFKPEIAEQPLQVISDGVDGAGAEAADAMGAFARKTLDRVTEISEGAPAVVMAAASIIAGAVRGDDCEQGRKPEANIWASGEHELDNARLPETPMEIAKKEAQGLNLAELFELHACTMAADMGVDVSMADVALRNDPAALIEAAQRHVAAKAEACALQA